MSEETKISSRGELADAISDALAGVKQSREGAIAKLSVIDTQISKAQGLLAGLRVSTIKLETLVADLNTAREKQIDVLAGFERATRQLNQLSAENKTSEYH